MRRLLLVTIAVVALGQTPNDITGLFRDAAAALAEANAPEFLSMFDKNMPSYATLRGEIENLLARGEVGSAIEIVTDQGDDRKRMLEVDWMLEIPNQKPRRAILKCTAEKQGKSWKITALDPVEFFKYE